MHRVQEERPRYYHDARAFREEFGQDDELLAMQNELIAGLEADAA